MKKLIICVCFGFIFFVNQAHSQNERRTLSVPFHGQGYTYWCWAASAAMVLDYEFNQDNYVCAVVSNYLSTIGYYINCCQNPVICNGGVTPANLYRYLNFHTGNSFSVVNNELDFEEIKYQIDNDHPIIVLLKGSTSFGDIGHAVVIVGYNETNNKVRVFDPAIGRSWVRYNNILNYGGMNWMATIYHD